MRRISYGIFLVALVTLMVELLLTRVFDVLLVPNVAYLIITCALFAFGLSGIYRVFRPPPDERAIHGFLCRTAIGFSLATLVILPATDRRKTTRYAWSAPAQQRPRDVLQQLLFDIHELDFLNLPCQHSRTLAKPPSINSHWRKRSGATFR